MRHPTSKASKIGRALSVCAVALGAAALVPLAGFESTALADQNNNPSQGNNNNPSQGSNNNPSQAPEASQAEIVTATGTIQKIDKNQRNVTLKGADGNTVDVKVGPNVNIDKLKVGDTVNAAYYSEVAVSLHKQGEAAPKMSQTTSQRGGVTAQQTTITAKVVSVDPQKNTVTLKGPQGNTKMLNVKDPDIQAQLHKIKAGDNVDVTYTQAVAVSVEPAKMTP